MRLGCPRSLETGTIRVPIAALCVAAGLITCAGFAAAGDGHTFATQLRRNVVLVETSSDGEVEYAHGFVVGMAHDQLLIATARHAIMCEEPGCESEVLVKLMGHAGWLVAEQENADASLDLALISVDRPEDYWFWTDCVDPFEASPETPVWPFGMDRDWGLPLESTPSYVKSIDAARTRIEIVQASVGPGASGAPVVSERGIIGMVRSATADDASALPIDVIQRSVDEWGWEWGLTYSSPPEDENSALSLGVHSFQYIPDLSLRWGKLELGVLVVPYPSSAVSLLLRGEIAITPETPLGLYLGVVATATFPSGLGAAEMGEFATLGFALTDYVSVYGGIARMHGYEDWGDAHFAPIAGVRIYSKWPSTQERWPYFWP